MCIFIIDQSIVRFGRDLERGMKKIVFYLDGTDCMCVRVSVIDV